MERTSIRSALFAAVFIYCLEMEWILCQPISSRVHSQLDLCNTRNGQSTLWMCSFLHGLHMHFVIFEQQKFVWVALWNSGEGCTTIHEWCWQKCLSVINVHRQQLWNLDEDSNMNVNECALHIHAKKSLHLWQWMDLETLRSAWKYLTIDNGLNNVKCDLCQNFVTNRKSCSKSQHGWTSHIIGDFDTTPVRCSLEWCLFVS